MNNIEFLKELKFFNENPDKAKVIDRSLIIAMILIQMLSFITLLNVIKFSEIILAAIFILCVLSIVIFCVYIEVKNKRYEDFQYVKYTGNPSDLFGDMSSPDIADYLDEIKNELKNYAGIRGMVAVSICSRINNPYIKEQRLKREAAKKMIQEIEIIQKRT